LRWLHTALPSPGPRLPGLRNEGFLATHELEVIRKSRKLDWDAAVQRARPALAHQGDALLKALGFTTERVDQVTQLLRAGTNDHRVAVAVLLRQVESPELAAARFTNLSPISYALEVATRENLRWVIISQAEADGVHLWIKPADLVKDTIEPLKRLGRLADSSISEIREARKARADAQPVSLKGSGTPSRSFTARPICRPEVTR